MRFFVYELPKGVEKLLAKKICSIKMGGKRRIGRCKVNLLPRNGVRICPNKEISDWKYRRWIIYTSVEGGEHDKRKDNV